MLSRMVRNQRGIVKQLIERAAGRGIEFRSVIARQLGRLAVVSVDTAPELRGEACSFFAEWADEHTGGDSRGTDPLMSDAVLVARIPAISDEAGRVCGLLFCLDVLEIHAPAGITFVEATVGGDMTDVRIGLVDLKDAEAAVAHFSFWSMEARFHRLTAISAG
jgi:hypothetical protein